MKYDLLKFGYPLQRLTFDFKLIFKFGYPLQRLAFTHFWLFQTNISPIIKTVKADFWYIDQLSGILNGSSVKIRLKLFRLQK